jgi:hypothetical protein
MCESTISGCGHPRWVLSHRMACYAFSNSLFHHVSFLFFICFFFMYCFFSFEQQDKMLQETIASNNNHLRWPMIAKAIPGRTGKQCRERYLNHLKPSLKLVGWSAVEDALIFRLHHSEGSKWALMSKLLRGRTDNSIKNRYHHLKRRLERQMQMVQSTKEMDELVTKLKTSRLLQSAGVEGWMLKYLANYTIMGGSKSAISSTLLDGGESFGPFRASSGEGCSRCGLVMPSLQTGRLVCESTGWCEACTRLSPCATGDMIRVVHGVAKTSMELTARRGC